MELVNCHTHTVYSGHGQGSVDQLVCAARQAGITTLAVTEHYPLPPELDPLKENAIEAALLPQYLQEISAAQQRYSDIEVVAGAEFDWLGDFETRAMDSDTFAPFAYALLSVHFIDGWGFDDPAYMGRWSEFGTDAVWRRYVELWIEAACSDWPIDAMAHPDLAKKFGYYPSFDLDKCYQEMTEALASTDKMVEVNTAGAYYDCQQMYPALELLRLFCRAGIPCSVGTDAHAPKHVTRGLDKAYALMYEAGYRYITVPTATGDRRRIPLS